MDESEKREAEEKVEEKKRDIPWWQRLNPMVLGGAAIVGFLILRSVITDSENKSNYMFWLIALLVVIYLLSQSPKAREEEMITPREAELLVERECERKKRWNQFGTMSKYVIGPVTSLKHRDGGGTYYNVSVEVVNPYDRTKYYNAMVMAKGIERGFVTIQESIGALTGRETVHEKTIIPEFAKRIGVDTVLEKMLFKER